MSDYKRLVSYIYRYYKEEKQQNIGYGRIETRNGQCKITVYIQAAGYVDTDLKMYFLKRDGSILWGIPAGTVKMKNGTGECKIATSSENLMGSGVALLDTAGILIRGNSDIYFASEWDEKPVSMENFKEYGDNKEHNEDEISEKEPEKEEPPSERKEEVKEAPKEEQVSTEELKMPEAVAKKEETEKKKQQDYWKLLKEALMAQETRVETREEAETEASEEENLGNNPQDENREQENNEQENREPEEWRQERERSSNSDSKDDDQRKTEELIQRIFNLYPEMNPFEEKEITRSVRFEPKDIGMLPMENWILGNNSFLLQGYYQYHHLIFAERLEDDKKTYFLGVPGINVEKERFLANIFGFKNFISTQKNKSQAEGAYGYWYKPISFTSA